MDFRRSFGTSFYPSDQNNSLYAPQSSDGPESVKYRFQLESPYNWQMPTCVKPDEDDDQSGATFSGANDYGNIVTDAELYVMKEAIGDNSKLHCVMKMPSLLPGGILVSSNTFNILMADVSGSMHEYWEDVETHWNKYVAPNLIGEMRIFTFDSTIRFRRSTPELEGSDFSQGGTELTGALQVIVSQVYTCKQKNVNVFFVTDGSHNGCSIPPLDVIKKMEEPSGKVCSVFVLGCGNYFPVKYSIDIRSRLHNGSANIPSLFWAKTSNEVEEQMKDIGSRVSGDSSVFMKLDVIGAPLPGLETKDTFHLGEYVYLTQEPEIYREINIFFSGNRAKMQLQPKEVDVITMQEIFRQWNSVIIQQKYKNAHIPSDILPLMERLFSTLMNAPKIKEGWTLAERLREKKSKGEEMEIRSLFNSIKYILTNEKFDNEIELAKSILSSTVTRSKYEVKTLQLKGHTDKEYERDIQEFQKIYEAHKDHIKNLEVAPEDVCVITKNSTVTDLQDESFPELMVKNKFEFLKAFTISGIPVFAPTRDSVTLNPWSFSVQRILKSPYVIMSQVAMETLAQESTDTKNKEVQVQQGNDSTNFNAVVPVFPPSVAKIMQPIVKTRLYAMCVTFATLKNPHMIDGNIHMAALGVTWVRCIFENPTTPRPEHIRIRMENIDATAALYMDRPGYVTYVKFLMEHTEQALMTESIMTADKNPVKCETLIKPMFFLNLIQKSENKCNTPKVAEIVRFILLEYIGRCLSHYKSEKGKDTPFTDFFAVSLDDQEKKKQWVQKYVEEAKETMSKETSASPQDGLLSSFYTLEKAKKAAVLIATEEVERNTRDLIADTPLKVNAEKIKQLRNVTSAGDVSWNTMEVFAREIGLGEDMIVKLFSEESITEYTVHALCYRSSRERLQKQMTNYDDCKTVIKKKVEDENLKIVSKELFDALIESIENIWLEEYLDVHSEVVEPMTRQQIVTLAQARGIDVTKESFEQVYKKYRPHVGLVGNACQTKACPYFLVPSKNYNQHASVERLKGRHPFMHSLHKISYESKDKDVEHIIKYIVSANMPDNQLGEAEVQNWTSDIRKLKNIYQEQAASKSGNS
ncbi:hypothetical protein SK128_000871 [Halocaridina rubra]|uniref:VWFA domain-containing protein n=1 Tax=Halocaridina rubra TaxID=373956 RepID=A0AAN8XEI6_HALRR